VFLGLIWPCFLSAEVFPAIVKPVCCSLDSYMLLFSFTGTSISVSINIVLKASSGVNYFKFFVHYFQFS
jgi:hypothetical protein